MSIVRMRKVFRNRIKAKIGKKHVNLPSVAEAIFYLIIIIFVVGAYYTFGGPGGGSGAQSGEGGRVTPVVAVVNGQKIPRELYEMNLNRMQNMSEMDPTQARWVKTSTLDGLTDAILMQQAAKKEGVRVTGADLDKKIDEDVEQAINMRLPDQKAKYRFLKKQGKTLEQYKAELRKEVAQDKEGLREQVAQQKLQELVEKRVTMTDEELKDSYTEVKASHILIKPEEAAKQAEAGGKTPATPVDGDALAKQKAEGLLAQVKAGADFAKLAKEHSQDEGSAVKGGDLGFFKRGAMVKEFEEAAFKLEKGQVSEPVKSPFGYHVIKVMDKRTELPKDFEKNKETFREQALSEKKYKAWQDYREELKKQATIEVRDPELQGYALLTEAMKGGAPDKMKQAAGIGKLEEAVKMNPANVTALWELASLYEQNGDKNKATELLVQATGYEEGARSPQIHLKLGGLYEDQKQKDKAVAEYKDAFDRASSFTQTNFFANMQIEQKLKSLGQPELAKQVSMWLEDYRKEMAKNPMGGMGGMGGMNPMGGMPMTIPVQ